LSFADFGGADLEGATFKRAFLDGVNFEGAKITHINQEQLNRACGNEHTKLPPGLTIPRCADKPGQ
jgi:uncharacterized protein YjbI with pentapeptide repeats